MISNNDESRGTDRTFQEVFFELDSLVNDFNNQLGDQLANTEQVFLSSYRAHMENVQKELSKFRILSKEREYDLMQDKTVRRLQEEADRFKKEALALKAQVKDQKWKIGQLSEKISVLEIENSLLK
jgi:hypothetical protein